MKACIDRDEVLQLDVYDELDEAEKAEWRRHLEQCPGCRQERRKMLRFLGRVKAELPPPLFSPSAAGRLSRAVKRGLADHGARGWANMIPTPSRTLAALAAACCVVVLSGWLVMKWIEGPSIHPDSRKEARITGEDIEIIKNMDILEDLETLRKLVAVMDQRDNNSNPEL